MSLSWAIRNCLLYILDKDFFPKKTSIFKINISCSSDAKQVSFSPAPKNTRRIIGSAFNLLVKKINNNKVLWILMLLVLVQKRIWPFSPDPGKMVRTTGWVVGRWKINPIYKACWYQKDDLSLACYRKLSSGTQGLTRPVGEMVDTPWRRWTRPSLLTSHTLPSTPTDTAFKQVK